ncbi:Ankyrin-2 [Dactylellina cionopaga]|nr:Ankyrin-2 [Dactylellina cionopaga]
MDWQLAAEKGNIDELDIALVDAGTGAQPLHYAAKGGQQQAVKALIDKKAPVDTQDKFGRTPLYIAVFNQHLAVVQLLLEQNANPNTTCQCGTSCVSKAAENGDIEMLDLLLENGASWKTKNQDGESPAYLALRNGHLIVSTMFENHEKERVRDFLEAARTGQLDDMKWLIQSGVDPSDRGVTGSSALDLAVKYGQVDAVSFLLNDGTINQGLMVQLVQSVDGGMRTALHWAALKGNVEIVELLLAAGGNPGALDKSGETPLRYAERKRQENVVEIFRKLEGVK